MTSNSSSTAGDQFTTTATTSQVARTDQPLTISKTADTTSNNRSKETHLTLAKLQQLSLISASAGSSSAATSPLNHLHNDAPTNGLSTTKTTLFKSEPFFNRDYTTPLPAVATAATTTFTLPLIKQPVSIISSNRSPNEPPASSFQNAFGNSEPSTVPAFGPYRPRPELGTLSFLSNNASKNVVLKLNDARSFLESSGKQLESPIKFSPTNPSNGFLPPSSSSSLQNASSSSALRMKRDAIKPCKAMLDDYSEYETVLLI
jgi:hypothetical protein